MSIKKIKNAFIKDIQKQIFNQEQKRVFLVFDVYKYKK